MEKIKNIGGVQFVFSSPDNWADGTIQANVSLSDGCHEVTGELHFSYEEPTGTTDSRWRWQAVVHEGQGHSAKSKDGFANRFQSAGDSFGQSVMKQAAVLFEEALEEERTFTKKIRMQLLEREKEVRRIWDTL